MRRPSSMVSSSERVSYTFTNGPRKIAQQIGGEEALLGQLPGADFAAAPVQPYAARTAVEMSSGNWAMRPAISPVRMSPEPPLAIAEFRRVDPDPPSETR